MIQYETAGIKLITADFAIGHLDQTKQVCLVLRFYVQKKYPIKQNYSYPQVAVATPIGTSQLQLQVVTLVEITGISKVNLATVRHDTTGYWILLVRNRNKS